MIESRKTRITIVLSAIWLALVAWLAFYEAGYLQRHNFDFSDFFSILIAYAVLPLLVVWGIAWIKAAPRIGKTEQ